MRHPYRLGFSLNTCYAVLRLEDSIFRIYYLVIYYAYKSTDEVFYRIEQAIKIQMNKNRKKQKSILCLLYNQTASSLLRSDTLPKSVKYCQKKKNIFC